MQTFSINERYPVEPPGEGFIAQLAGASFHAVGFCRNLRRREIDGFEKGRLRYGAWGWKSAAFFLMDIRNFATIDLSLNLAIVDEDTRDAFFSDEANVISLILCDYPPPTIRAMRVIGVSYRIMRELKALCKRQDAFTASDIQDAYHTFTTAEMIARCEMVTLGMEEERDEPI
jgi:hypothetical protein